MKPTVYIETTVPSYYTSRPSRDIIVLAHQEITRIWWDERLQLFEAYISQVVIEEAGGEMRIRRINVLICCHNFKF